MLNLNPTKTMTKITTKTTHPASLVVMTVYKNPRLHHRRAKVAEGAEGAEVDGADRCPLGSRTPSIMTVVREIQS